MVECRGLVFNPFTEFSASALALSIYGTIPFTNRSNKIPRINRVDFELDQTRTVITGLVNY